MSKKHKKHEEHANHERWLVSYADFITLLFAFFVVMFSSSQVDQSKTNKLALAVEAAFSTFSIFKDAGGQMNLTTSPSATGTPSQSTSSQVATEAGDPIFLPPKIYESDDRMSLANNGDPDLSENSGIPTPESEALGRVEKSLISLISERKLANNVAVNLDKRGVVISIREAGFFESGAENMTPISWDILEGVGKIISSVPNQIRVEGHTDTQAVNHNLFPSNWELSSARASSVLRWLVEKHKMNPERFSVVGYGEFRPIASNLTPEGRLRNRRVDIVILSNKAAEREAPIPLHPKEETLGAGGVTHERS